ncbi:MAG: hypothetical protein WCP08_03095 [Prolixibacteraceae bacterium]
MRRRTSCLLNNLQPRQGLPLQPPVLTGRNGIPVSACKYLSEPASRDRTVMEETGRIMNLLKRLTII